MRRLTDADRAELCRRVDFLAVLDEDGVAVRRSGAAYVCRLRPDERTASCYVYPPGVGRYGARGWTLHDYGDGWGGDALSYLVDRRGLSYTDAVDELCRRTGWTPPAWRPGADVRHSARLPERRAPTRPTAPTITVEEQLDAAAAFMAEVLAVAPEAGRLGSAYLASRGCLPPDVGHDVAWVVSADELTRIAARIAGGPDADLLARAGLFVPSANGRPHRLPWWDRVALLGCRDPFGRLVYFVGRRLDWRGWGAKYVNQATAGGATRYPYGLPALYRAAGRLRDWPSTPDPAKAGDVLLVEGVMDALGAACLGWPAVALLARLHARHYADRDGAAARLLEPHLPALRDVRRVVVVPDADGGAKGDEGDAMAARLAGWLTCAGVRAHVARVTDLFPGSRCKDLAEVAYARQRTDAPRPPPRVLETTGRGEKKGTP